MAEPTGVAFRYVNGRIDGKIIVDGLTKIQAIFMLTVVEEKIKEVKSHIIKTSAIEQNG